MKERQPIQGISVPVDELPSMADESPELADDYALDVAISKVSGCFPLSSLNESNISIFKEVAQFPVNRIFIHAT